EESKEDRPAVQVGDPFREKLLLEACLELLASGCVAGIQDMGAAGLTCSTCETASRGGTGVEIDLNLVPKRETGMTPYEILLSESQERMLVIVNKGEEDKVRAIFEKWDLPFAEVGIVNDDGMMRVREGDSVAVEIPARNLADDAPLYSRDAAAKSLPAPLNLEKFPEADCTVALHALLAHPSIASKRWVWRQYDHMVRLGATVLPGSDAAVFVVREANKILAASTDCNAIYCRQDPREGAKIAVAEAARNIACTGAIPLALTDNLNFGNPHKPENFLQLREAVEGMAEACRKFDTPVTGGNVSLYNESPAGAIDPTPTVGMVGIVEDAKHITTQFFKAAGDTIILVGEPGEELGASHYLLAVHGVKAGPRPKLDYDKELAVQDAVRSLIRSGLVKSAHDCAEGGLAVALAESCISGDKMFGASVEIHAGTTRADIPLFNESQSRIVISVESGKASGVLALLEEKGVPARRLGTVTAAEILEIATAGKSFSWPLPEIHGTWAAAIPSLMGE
ncbi:MAG: phosphoribosylformylglycinamidine synthase subunit PurL, partial [Verrucomicrobiota bacterium]